MNRHATVANLAALLLTPIGLVGCAGGSNVERTSYVDANKEIFDKLPRFPGSGLIEEVSTPYRDGEAGPITGYGTRFVLVLPDKADGDDVSAFYERRLDTSWQVVERLEGPVLNLRQGRAGVSINLEGWRAHSLEISVDHAGYDVGR